MNANLAEYHVPVNADVLSLGDLGRGTILTSTRSASLHGGLAKGEDPTLANRAPQYMVADTDCGVIYGAYRDLPNGQRNWRFAQFCMPFFTQPPPTRLGHDAVLRALCPWTTSTRVLLDQHEIVCFVGARQRR
jgi:hypothetical protein